MRVFVAVQPTPRSGASSLSRYIAQSKVDRDREQVDDKGSRPLFSEREDDLTYSEADRILNPTSGELDKEDVIHVVISPEQGSFERAGETAEERKKTFREAIRDAVHKMARELKVRALNWIGGLHGNTRTPHGHLAVSRWAIDEKTGKLVYIKHLPESLLPRNREGQDGTKRFSTGKIAEVFARALNLRRKPVRFVQVQDRESGNEISRSVLSPYALMLREPTPQERVVGRWIEAELTLSRAVGEGAGGKEELTRECIELRGLVAELDAAARAQGARPAAGYVEPERLEELIRGNLGTLGVNVFTERPHGQEEKYVERTIAQSGTRADEQTLTVPQERGQSEVKVSLSTPQLISEPSPANAAPVKFTRPREDARDKVEVTPRVATKTLKEMRSHIVLSRSSDAAIDKATEAREAIKGHDIGTQQISTKQGAQSVERVAKLTLPIPNIPSARTERADATNPEEKLVATKEPLKESRLNDEELGRLAHSVRFNRLYMERERDILAAVTRTEVEHLQQSGDRDNAKTGAALEPLYSFESRVREAILLDHIYDDARQKRNIPSQRLSDTQADLLKGRESWQVTQLKNSLPSEMETAREQLLAVAPLADPSRVKMYNQYQEEQRALAALARDREKQTPAAVASHDSKQSTAQTLEHDSHSTIITALPGKEDAPSQALVEEAIELIL
ncbi:MAG: hypothetical protein ACREBG_17515 [Pyrinomonadaceae bacterium]